MIAKHEEVLIMQIIKFSFSRYIDLIVYLDLHYVYIHTKSYISKLPKWSIIWDRGSIKLIKTSSIVISKGSNLTKTTLIAG